MKILRIILSVILGAGLSVAFLYYYGYPRMQTAIGPIPRPAQTWTLLAVGDIQLGREVAVKINQFGVDYPFEVIKDITNQSNITMGNLESPLTSGKSNTDPNTMIFGAEIKSVEDLKNAGFDVLNLANNHFSNQGQNGMNLTFDALNNNGIDYFGAGTNFTAAHQALIREIKGIKIAFLGYTDTNVLPSGSTATDSTPGVGVMDVEQVEKDIVTAKTQADIIIVSMHSGYEYTPNPNNRQIEFAHAAVDAGADVVIGHHPHVVQAIEDYKGKKIFYSLGNFIFDQPWSTETKQGLMVKLTFNGKNLTKTDLVPIKIENWSQPRILSSDEPEYNSILERISKAMEKLK